MTNRLSFVSENIRHACHFAVGAWLSNFCHGVSNLLGTFSNIYENSKKFWESGKKSEEKNSAWFKEKLTVIFYEGLSGYLYFFKLLSSLGHI